MYAEVEYSWLLEPLFCIFADRKNTQSWIFYLFEMLYCMRKLTRYSQINYIDQCIKHIVFLHWSTNKSLLNKTFELKKTQVVILGEFSHIYITW